MAALFQGDFVGLTGAPDKLKAVYDTFDVYFEKYTTGESAAGYLVSHLGSAFVVDTRGRWRVRLSFGTPAEDIVHDIREISSSRRAPGVDFNLLFCFENSVESL